MFESTRKCVFVQTDSLDGSFAYCGHHGEGEELVREIVNLIEADIGERELTDGESFNATFRVAMTTDEEIDALRSSRFPSFKKLCVNYPVIRHAGKHRNPLCRLRF